MNKLISKIVGVCLGSFMAMGVGIGVTVGSQNRDIVRPAEAAAVAGTFEKVTSSSLNVGDIVIFVNSAGTKALGDLSATSSGYGTLVDVTTTNNQISLAATTTVTQFVVEAGASSGYAFLAQNNTNFENYYMAYTSTATSKSNYLNRYGSNTSSNKQGQFTISYGSTMAVRSVYNTGRWLRFNSDRFACYYNASSESTTGTGVNIYKKFVSSDSVTAISNITGTPTGLTHGSWDLSSLTVRGTLNGTANSDITSYVDLSSSTPVPSTTGTTSVSVTATLKDGVSGGATPYTTTLTGTVSEGPIISSNLKDFSWGSTTYQTSPHTLTMKSTYTWGASAGQLNSGLAYLGTNDTNKAFSTVNGESWTMSASDYSSLASAMSSASYWSTYGSALRMLNFGVVHPTSFSITAGTVGNTSDKYFIFASTDSGDSWTYLTGNTTMEASSPMIWTGNTYASVSNPVQFAFVFTGSSAGKTISNIDVEVYGESLATTKVLDSIYLSGTPKTSYLVGQTFDLNGAKVYARYTDSTTYPDEDVSTSVSWSVIAHGTTEVTGTFNDKTVKVTVSVSDEGSVYKKIVSTNELIEGAKVVIGTSNGSYTAGAQTKNNRHPEAAGGPYGYYDDGDVENWSVNTTVFTIGITENGYTFHDGDGYLYAASSSDNYLRTEAELDENLNGEWSISISEGVATIVAQGNNTHNTINGNGTAFGAYAEPTVTISLYADVAGTIQAFIYSKMHTDIPYNPDPTLPINNAGNCSSQSWYVQAKSVLVGLGSAYIAEFQNNNTFNDAQARYEAWASACHDSTPYEGEGIVPAAGTNIVDGITNKNSTVIIIVIASVLSLASFGVYFLLRKKKEVK